MPARKIGRPRVEINLKTLEALCRMGCTHDEIAAAFDITTRALEIIRKRDPEIKAVMERAKLRGRISLRRKLREMANEGNVTALIFACKNECGMSDRVSAEVSGPGGGPIELVSDASRRIKEKLDRLRSREANR